QIVDLEAVPRVADRPSVVRVRNAGCREGRGSARRRILGRTGPARPGSFGIVVEVWVARLIEGDEVSLGERVAAAGVELHVFAGLIRGADAERVDAVLLNVGEAGEVDLLRTRVHDGRRGADRVGIVVGLVLRELRV